MPVGQRCILCNMKSFTVELMNLSNSDYYTTATVYYEGDQIYEVEDENGRVWPLRELSIWDINIINKRLIQNLLADVAWRWL